VRLLLNVVIIVVVVVCYTNEIIVVVVVCYTNEIIVVVVVCYTNEIRTNKRAIMKRMNPMILEAVMNTLILEGTPPAANIASI